MRRLRLSTSPKQYQEAMPMLRFLIPSRSALSSQGIAMASPYDTTGFSRRQPYAVGEQNASPRRSKAPLWLAVWALTIALTFLLTTRLKAAPDVVFFGDSITEMWALPSVNFGIYGNTTTQMLARFNDVTDSYFTRVVIVGGTNDVLTDTDPDITIRNLHQMIALALAKKKLEVLVGTIPPIYQDGGNLLPKVDALNQRIVQEVNQWKASGASVELVDFNESLKNSQSGFAEDGVHMRRRNYVKMDLKLLSVNNIFFRKN
jgi:hypothetical protein